MPYNYLPRHLQPSSAIFSALELQSSLIFAFRNVWASINLWHLMSIIGLGRLRLKHYERHIRRSCAVQGLKLWLRKAAIVNEGNSMAFQGRQRAVSHLLPPNCILPLMNKPISRISTPRSLNIKKQVVGKTVDFSKGNPKKLLPYFHLLPV